MAPDIWPDIGPDISPAWGSASRPAAIVSAAMRKRTMRTDDGRLREHGGAPETRAALAGPEAFIPR